MSVKTLPSNFSIMCRTCLTASNQLKSLFVLESFLEEPTNSLGSLLMSFASIQVVTCSFCQIILEVVNFQIIKGDGLPENICLNCIQNLNNAVSFRKLCERSNETLRLWLATSQENSQRNQFFVCDGFQRKQVDRSLSNISTTGLHFIKS